MFSVVCFASLYLVFLPGFSARRFLAAAVVSGAAVLDVVSASAPAVVFAGLFLLRRDSIASSVLSVVVGLSASCGLSVGIGNGIFSAGGVSQACFLSSCASSLPLSLLAFLSYSSSGIFPHFDFLDAVLVLCA